MAQTCRVLCITVLCQALFPVYKDKSGLGDFQQSDTETRLMSDRFDNVCMYPESSLLTIDLHIIFRLINVKY